MPPPATLRLLQPTDGDVEAFAAHLARQLAESGTDGRPVFAPAIDLEAFHSPEKKAHFRARWSRPVGDGDWQRTFGAFVEGALVGHADLRSRGLPSAHHRALLGLGVESAHWRRGLGRALLHEAVRFAREDTELAWIDLGVFAHNTHALRLYRQAGFRETGRVADLFRVRGTSVEDVQMALPLRARSTQHA
ncbi:MAG: GNAT family N-acetyltransferase [Myxococcales bacterium]